MKGKGRLPFSCDGVVLRQFVHPLAKFMALIECLCYINIPSAPWESKQKQAKYPLLACDDQTVLREQNTVI